MDPNQNLGDAYLTGNAPVWLPGQDTAQPRPVAKGQISPMQSAPPLRHLSQITMPRPPKPLIDPNSSAMMQNNQQQNMLKFEDLQAQKRAHDDWLIAHPVDKARNNVLRDVSQVVGRMGLVGGLVGGVGTALANAGQRERAFHQRASQEAQRQLSDIVNFTKLTSVTPEQIEKYDASLTNAEKAQAEINRWGGQDDETIRQHNLEHADRQDANILGNRNAATAEGNLGVNQMNAITNTDRLAEDRAFHAATLKNQDDNRALERQKALVDQAFKEGTLSHQQYHEAQLAQHYQDVANQQYAERAAKYYAGQANAASETVADTSGQRVFKHQTSIPKPDLEHPGQTVLEPSGNPITPQPYPEKPPVMPAPPQTFNLGARVQQLQHGGGIVPPPPPRGPSILPPEYIAQQQQYQTPGVGGIKGAIGGKSQPDWTTQVQPQGQSGAGEAVAQAKSMAHPLVKSLTQKANELQKANPKLSNKEALEMAYKSAIRSQ